MAALAGMQLMGVSELQIQRFPTPVGPGQAGGGKMGSRAAPGRLEGPSGPSHEGHHWHKPPQCRADIWGESRTVWGVGGTPAPSTGPAGTQGTPCSSGASHQGDVLVTDTSVLCSSVCRKWNCKLLLEMLPSSHPLHATEMNICLEKKYWKKFIYLLPVLETLKKVSEAFNIKCSNPLKKNPASISNSDKWQNQPQRRQETISIANTACYIYSFPFFFFPFDKVTGKALTARRPPLHCHVERGRTLRLNTSACYSTMTSPEQVPKLEGPQGLQWEGAIRGARGGSRRDGQAETEQQHQYF